MRGRLGSVKRIEEKQQIAVFIRGKDDGPIKSPCAMKSHLLKDSPRRDALRSGQWQYDVAYVVESVAQGLVTVGALIMVAGGVLANIVFVRYVATQKLSTEDPVIQRAAVFRFGSSLLLCGALGFGGACILVLGLIVGNGTAAWTIAIPLVPLV